jgi:adenosine deaminase
VSVESYLAAMPKVELHVHLEGSVQPSTLLEIARRNRVRLPASSIDELAEWYRFRDFGHFIDVYATAARALCTPEDVELIAREFLEGQARQNVRYSEVTYTALTQYRNHGMAFEGQLDALNRARRWGEQQHGVSMGVVIDIPRGPAPKTAEETMMVAGWVVAGHGWRVVALGLGGMELGFPAGDFVEPFDHVRAAGIPSVPHAGEADGAWSVRQAVDVLHAARIGHGIWCVEDPVLMEELRDRRIPLEVCPTSNVCLAIVDSMVRHPLRALFDAGLVVTVNSDDPPMFNTSLTEEYLALYRYLGFTIEELEQLSRNAVRSSFLADRVKKEMAVAFEKEFQELRQQHLTND